METPDNVEVYNDFKKSLLSKYQREDLYGKCILMNQKTKKFYLFKSYTAAHLYLNGLSQEQKVFNEVILGEWPQKVMFDIDDKEGRIKDAASFCKDFCSLIKQVFMQKYFISPDIIVYNSSGDVVEEGRTYYKHSFHFIVAGYVLKEIADVKYFAECVYEAAAVGVKALIDMSIYNSGLHQFRLPFNTKPANPTRIKLPYPPFVGDNLFAGYIGYADDCYELESLNEKKINSKNAANDIVISMDDIPPSVINNVFKEYEFLDAFEIREVVGNLVLLNRLKPSYCEICGRTHKKDNTGFLMKKTDGIYFVCRRKKEEHMLLHKMESVESQTSSMAVKEEMPDLVELDYFEYNKERIKHFPASYKTFLLRANMKMGKTGVLRKHINKTADDEDIVIFLSFRQTFSSNIKTRFVGFKMYNEISGNIDINKYNRLIIQIESLWRIAASLQNRRPFLVVLDESESILNQFDSGLFKNYIECWNVFKWLLKNSERVVCMDAFLGNRTINVIKKCRGLPIIMHWNKYKNAAKDKYHMMPNISLLYAKLRDEIEELAAEEKVAVICNSLTDAEAINEMLKADFSGKLKKPRIKFYSGKTSASEKKKDMSNIVDAWRDIDVVIYTPTITAGISYEEKAAFRSIFGIFTNLSCDVRTCFQMLHRIRDVITKNYYIYINQTPQHLPATREEIKNQLYSIRESVLKKYNSADFLARDFDESGKIKYNENEYFCLWLNNALVKNQSTNSFIHLFKYFVTLIGSEYIEVKNIELDCAEDIKKAKASVTKKLAEMRAEGTAKAKDLTPEEEEDIREKLSNEEDISAEERYSLERASLRKIYKWENNIDRDFVVEYSNKSLQKQYKCLSLFCGKGGISEAMIALKEKEINKIAADMQNDVDDDYKFINDLKYNYKFPALRIIAGFFQIIGIRSFDNDFYLEKNEFVDIIEKNRDKILAAVNDYQKIEFKQLIGKNASPADLIKHMSAIMKKNIGFSIIEDKSGIYQIKRNDHFVYGDSKSQTKPLISLQ